MNQTLLKPVLVAGFSFLAALQATAQDYIDVEAEREAARRAREAQLANPAAPSPAPVTEPDALVPTYSTPPSGNATDAPASSSGYGAIRPYSGTTRVVTPVTSGQPAPINAQATGNLGDLVIMVQQLEAEVRRLNGVVEEQAGALRRLEEQSLERYVDLDRRLAGGGVSTSMPAGGGSSVGSPSFGPAASSGGLGGGIEAAPGEEAAYRAAYDLVRNRQFPAAVQSFRAFLDQYPLGRFAPNAHYWLGELYLVAEPPDPELARQSFQLLLDQYPNDSKVPDALYKLGRVHFLKGNRERSREYLERVIAQYGDENHPAAQLARDFIDENF